MKIYRKGKLVKVENKVDDSFSEVELTSHIPPTKKYKKGDEILVNGEKYTITNIKTTGNSDSGESEINTEFELEKVGK